MQDFLAGPGKKRLVDVLGKAGSLLRGEKAANETLASITVDDGESIEAHFSGLRWKTVFFATIPGIMGKDHEFSCECRESNDGGLCIHFWVAVLFTVASEKVSGSPAGLDSFAGDVVKEAAATVPQEALDTFLPRNLPEGPLDTVLATMTMGKRLETARQELGIEGDDQSPSKKKRGKASTKKVEPVSIEWKRFDAGPPAIIEPRFFRGEGDEKRESSLHVLIDEESKLLVHQNCKDFEIRMMRDKKLCKHLIATFLSIDESVARRILSNLQGFTFRSFAEPARPTTSELAASIIEEEPDVSMDDGVGLKDEVLTWLLDRGTAVMDEITSSFGSRAAKLVKVMVGEGIIEEISPDTFSPK